MAKTVGFNSLLARLQQDFPEITFAEAESFYWSPANQHVMYKQGSRGNAAIFSLLHEVGHANLDHKRYRLDFELLQLESAAWEQAKRLAPRYGITIDEDHIQDCLDSYRDWLYGRSICPTCSSRALQQDDLPQYRCHNCHTIWDVTPSRFCRPYRRQKSTTPTMVFADHKAL